jgi:hypothetical protein
MAGHGKLIAEAQTPRGCPNRKNAVPEFERSSAGSQSFLDIERHPLRQVS